MSDQNPVHVLHPEESWGFLRTHEFGRLAFHLVGEVHITPINYAVDGERLIFKTAEGSKLFGVTANTDVAFEVDEIVGDRATSVIVRGRARTLEGQAAYIVERLPVRPWVDTPEVHRRRHRRRRDLRTPLRPDPSLAARPAHRLTGNGGRRRRTPRAYAVGVLA